MKRIIALILTVASLLALLASCGGAKTPAEIIADADAAALEAPYKTVVSMTFETNNEEMNAVLEMMNMPGMEMYIDGNNYYSSTEVMGMKMEMTLVDNVVYYNYPDANMKFKTTITAEEAEEMMGSNGTTDFTPEDFAEVTVTEKDGKTVVTCTGINEEAMDSALSYVKDSFEGLGELKVGEVSIVSTVADGKYESVALSISYEITVNGETVAFDMEMNATFDFEAGREITAPADADSYQEQELGI